MMALFLIHDKSDIHVGILNHLKGDPKIPNAILKYVTWIKKIKSINITNFGLSKSTWFHISQSNLDPFAKPSQECA